MKVSDLNETQRNAVRGSDIIIDINVFSGTQKITELGGKLTVTVSPYNGPTPPAVWYLNEAGELEKIPSSYNPATKTVTFIIDHLSLYVLGENTEAVVEQWDNPFTDVKESDWFYSYVGFVFSRGLMTGTAADAFRPNVKLTRGMIVTILYRYAGSPSASGTDNPFSDVPTGEWYTEAAIWAAENGIVEGYGNGEYRPDNDITRQDLATILMRYAKCAGIELTAEREYRSFDDDADITDYAREAVESFYMAGVINGKPGNNFDPKGSATRAEVATMIYGLIMIAEG